MASYLVNLTKKIRLTPSQRNLGLGRWGTILNDNEQNSIKREKSIEFNIDNANHDHCGSELCNKQEIIKKEKKQTFMFDDEYYPYII